MTPVYIASPSDCAMLAVQVLEWAKYLAKQNPNLSATQSLLFAAESAYVALTDAALCAAADMQDAQKAEAV